MKGRSSAAAAHRDLFDPPITWTPPKEFADLLVERGLAAALLPTAAPAPAPALEPAPALAPGQPPAALTPAAPAAPGAAPAPAAPANGRNFAADTERVQLGKLMVIRERGADGHHTYCAYERADAFFHRVTLDELTWGRIDTRRSLRELDPYRDYDAIVSWQMECSALAREAIRQLCPETRLAPNETPPGAGVYDGLGYVLVTVDPEFRYRAARAREVP